MNLNRLICQFVYRFNNKNCLQKTNKFSELVIKVGYVYTLNNHPPGLSSISKNLHYGSLSKPRKATRPTRHLLKFKFSIIFNNLKLYCRIPTQLIIIFSTGGDGGSLAQESLRRESQEKAEYVIPYIEVRVVYMVNLHKR